MGAKHDVRGGRTLGENLIPEPMMMGEVLTQPEKPEVDAFPTEPVEQSTAQVKLVRHE